jgi:membrane-bound serine protease (ClpP class)
MHAMTDAILNSPVPVVVWVAPAAARAASAGMFLTIAAHVAAMAPGTNIGAAHPVARGGGRQRDDGAGAAGEKLVRTCATPSVGASWSGHGTFKSASRT